MIGNQQLRKAFNYINDRFFDGAIPASTVVKFADIKDDGTHTKQKGISTILIQSRLKKHPDLATICLIHEMIHADLKHSGYMGYSADLSHNLIFYARLHQLYMAGIYEGLL